MWSLCSLFGCSRRSKLTNRWRRWSRTRGWWRRWSSCIYLCIEHLVSHPHAVSWKETQRNLNIQSHCEYQLNLYKEHIKSKKNSCRNTKRFFFLRWYVTGSLSTEVHLHGNCSALQPGSGEGSNYWNRKLVLAGLLIKQLFVKRKQLILQGPGHVVYHNTSNQKLIEESFCTSKKNISKKEPVAAVDWHESELNVLLHNKSSTSIIIIFHGVRGLIQWRMLHSYSACAALRSERPLSGLKAFL